MRCMPNQDPLATLYGRLRPESGPFAGNTGGDTAAEDESDAAIPGWIPDGHVAERRDWFTAVRADPGRSGGIALAIVAVLAILITAFAMIRQRPTPVASANLPPVEAVPTALPTAGPTSGGPQPPANPASVASEASVVVSVVGLVDQPGLVTLTPSARVADAVAAAGGALHGADTLGLNLARHLVDGEQIVVGIATPAGQHAALGSSVGPPAAPPPAADTPAKPVGPVDLNKASAEELDALPGVGPITAAAIIAWRSANGRFTSVDQLGEVDGIGPGRLEKLRALVRV